MKKIYKALILILSISVLFSACGNKGGGEQKGTENKDNKPVNAKEEYFLWDEFETTKIVGYSEEGLKQKELTIPAKCTEFAYSALKENPTVEKISFESDDTPLNGLLFNGCTALRSIELPQNITEIPVGLLEHCSALEYINIPDGVKEIGKYAFWDCSALKTVTLGKHVEKINKNAFMNCTNLTKIEFPDSLKIIEEYAFAYNNNLQQVDFPNGLETIGEWAFYNCHQFKKVELPETLTSLGKMAFTYCDGLTEIYLPASLNEVPKTAFSQRANTLTVFVKEGSAADTQFDTYNDGGMVKEYY